MRLVILLAALWELLAGPAAAHVGSPNVFFAGRAGPHPVLVIIQPPATLPGAARVEVRLPEEGPATVRLAAAFSGSSSSDAPPPTTAVPAPENGHYYRGDLWLLRRGSYRVEVKVEGPGGSGTVVIPLNSAATQTPVMPIAQAVALATLGLLLAAAAVMLVRAAARVAALAPRAVYGGGAEARGRQATVTAALLVTAAVAAGAARWWAMDRNFRERALDRPVEMAARVDEEGGLCRLHLASLTPNPHWDALVTDHGKLLHLFLVEEAGTGAFAHLHPVRRSASEFEGLVPSLPAGHYRVYGEITFANGATQTLTAQVNLPPLQVEPAQATLTTRDEALCQTVLAPEENEPRPTMLAADDAWHAGPIHPPDGLRAAVCRLPDGATVVLHNAGDLVQNREISLRFSVYGANGNPLPLRPYMGMAGHVALYREDGSVFAHLHPAGSISMAAQRLLDGSPLAVVEPEAPGVEISFPYAFPQAGRYRVWGQFRTRTGLVTGAFAVQVRPP